MIRAIRQKNPSYPINPEEFEKAYPVHDYKTFFDWYQYIDPIEGELDYFYPILARHIDHLKKQSVLYTEIMIPAGEIPADNLKAIEKVTALRNFVEQQENGKIQVEFLVVFVRSKPPDRIAAIAERVLALFEAGLIVGVSFAGPEQGYPVKPYRKIFQNFSQAGMGIQIHAGEWCGPESVWDALEYGYPNRIGHGVSIFQDPQLLKHIRDNKIHIEMCPTSNLKTGSIKHIEDHPVRLAKELGLNYSINTDDPGPFECCLTSEYQLLTRVFGFDEEDFRQIFKNSLAARFQPQLRIEL